MCICRSWQSPSALQRPHASGTASQQCQPADLSWRPSCRKSSQCLRLITVSVISKCGLIYTLAINPRLNARKLSFDVQSMSSGTAFRNHPKSYALPTILTSSTSHQQSMVVDLVFSSMTRLVGTISSEMSLVSALISLPGLYCFWEQCGGIFGDVGHSPQYSRSMVSSNHAILHGCLSFPSLPAFGDI